MTAIELVFEATACGLTINVAKCRLGPTTRVRYLGNVIDSRLRVFTLPVARVLRISLQVRELAALVANSHHVPARIIAQLVGLLWSITPCCPRAVSIMARGMVDVLARAMRVRVWNPTRPDRHMRFLFPPPLR